MARSLCMTFLFRAMSACRPGLWGHKRLCAGLCHHTGHLPRGMSLHYQSCAVFLYHSYASLSFDVPRAPHSVVRIPYTEHPTLRYESDTTWKPAGSLPISKGVHLLLETQGQANHRETSLRESAPDQYLTVCYPEALRNLGDSLHELPSTEMTDKRIHYCHGCYIL